MTNRAKIELLQARINVLKARDESGNMNIINKIKRNIRKLENQEA